ncbi:MAG TPA: site-2 protease family protein [Methanomassiliicoccales archaeon]|nr:site-2 protease family protein [Methanomassiliicoccales archaeon]HXZ23977.1 site-2 protease family protein [Methanomassiliicoccales archaeon]
MSEKPMSGMYDEYGALYIPPGYGKIHFGRTELMHIGIAVLVLTLAFTLAMLSGNSYSLYTFAIVFAIAAVAVLTGFLLHELMHKFVAQRYGAWAEFRIFPMGLMLALVFSFFGFVFAAPGAVYIQGRITPKQNGLISAAGPGLNLALAAVFLVASMAFPFGTLAYFAFMTVGTINSFLALFNMVPVPPLDGSKVLMWSKPVYILMLAASAVALAYAWGFI